MKQLWKRTISAGLSLIMILSLSLAPLPGDIFLKMVEASGNYVLTKDELALGVNVISKALSEDDGFKNQYIRTNGTSMNVNGEFKKDTEVTHPDGPFRNVKNAGETLSRDKMMHKKVKSGWHAYYAWRMPDQVRNSSYDLVFEGNVFADEHRYLTINAYDHWDRGIVKLNGQFEFKASKKDDEKAQPVTATINCENFDPTVYAQKDYSLRFSATHTGCNCGESAVSECTFYMVDKSIPIVQNIYIATDENGENRLSGGTSFGTETSFTAYAVLEFSENVRFSDNIGKIDDKEVKLNLDAYHVGTNQSVEDTIISGTLSSINGNKMIFKFDVPSKIGGNNTNIYIAGISSTQDFIGKDYKLKIYDRSGSEFNAGSRTVKSYITDISGNALNWEGSTKSCGYVYFDNVAPTMTGISMTGNMITAESSKDKEGWSEGADLSAVYAGTGDWISFEVRFSESVNLNVNHNNVKAVLSIKGVDGNNVKLACTGVHNGKLSFEKLSITEDMLKAGERIKITGFENLDKVADRYGNALAAGTGYNANLTDVTMVPKEGIYLDVDAPLIKTDLTATDNVYTPHAYKEGNYFTFPVIINEDVSNVNNELDDTSQIEPQPAHFSVVMEGEKKPYYWYVDTTQQIDKNKFENIEAESEKAINAEATAQNDTGGSVYTGATEEEATKNAFTPVDNQVHYIHLKLDENVDYNYTSYVNDAANADSEGIYFEGNIYVYAQDNAGNNGTASFAVKHQVDTTAPTAQIDEAARVSVDYTNEKATLTVPIMATDNYSVKSITYKWIDITGTTKTETEPVTLTDVGTGLVKDYKNELSYEFSFDANTNEGRQGSAKLTLSVEDWAGQSYTIKSEKEYTWNFQKSIANYEITNGGTAFEPSLTPEVVLSEPTQMGTDGGTENTRTIMLIKYGENEDGTSNYYFYDPREAVDLDDNGSYDVNYDTKELINNLLVRYNDPSGNNDDEYAPGFWGTLSGTIADGEGDFINSGNIPLNSTKTGEAYEFITGSYGTIEINFVTFTGFDLTKPYNNLTGDDYDFNAASSTVKTETLYLANGAAHEVTAGAVMKDGIDVKEQLDYKAGNIPATDLDNVAITLHLENIKDKDSNMAYDLETIDFTKSKIELFYYGNNITRDGTVLKDAEEKPVEWELNKSHEQTVVIPEDVAKEIGWYGLKVTLCDIEGEETVTKFEQFYFMDPVIQTMQLESYYKAYLYEKDAVYEEDDKPDNTLVVRDNKDLSSEANKDSVIYVPLGIGPKDEWTVDTRIKFSRTFRYERDANIYGLKESIKLRVYNLADENAEKNAFWIDASSSDLREFTYTPTYVEGFTSDSYGTRDALLLPLLEGANVIRYELVNTNGVVESGERIVYTYLPIDGVSFYTENTKISDRTGGIMEASVGVSVPVEITPPTEHADPSTAGETTFSYYPHYEHAKTAYTFKDDFDKEFWLVDQNGNLYAEQIAVSDIDGVTPIVSNPNDTEYDIGDVFSFSIYAQDFEHPISPEEFVLTFDADYSSLLWGFTDKERIANRDSAADGQMKLSMPIPVNTEKAEDGTYLPWESYDTNHYGIFRTQIYEDEYSEKYGYTVGIKVYGTWKYDEAVAEGRIEAPDKRTFTFSAMDANGNTSSDEREYSYINPSYDLGCGIKLEDDFTWYEYLYPNGELGIYAGVPFNQIHSYGAGKQTEYYYSWAGQRVYATTAPMIQQDGYYNFQVIDLFGDDYELPLNVFAFGDTGIDVAFSETDMTNKDVKIDITATLDGDSIISISGVLDDGTIVEGSIDESDNTKASIMMTANGKVTVSTKLGKERKIPILNIDKKLEKATVIYQDSNGKTLTGNETEAEGEVTAIVQCSESIYGTNGPLKYAFLSGSKKGAAYTFEYQDAAGNKGSIKAVLPCNVKDLPAGYVDKTAPEYILTVYGVKGSKYINVADIPNLTGEELSEDLNAYPAQSYRFILTVKDDSAAKVVIQPTGSTAPTNYSDVKSGSTVEHVSLVGNVIDVTDNTSFDMHIIDANNNVTSVTGITIEKIRKEVVPLQVIYDISSDNDGYPAVKAIFLPENDADAKEKITPLYKNLPRIVMNGNEYYYYTFSKNGSYTFNYEDAYGNYGQILAQVQSISTAAPVVENVTWLGTRRSGNNITPENSNITPEKSDKVNKDVTANLDMSKAIRGVRLYKYDEQMEDGIGDEIPADAPVKVTFADKNIYITYAKNVDYQITVQSQASESGRYGYYVLPAVTCIDKKAPKIILDKKETSKNKRSMTFTFTTSEECVLSENAAAGYEQKHTWTATDNKPVKLTFTDKAGNKETYDVKENETLDVTYLRAEYSLSEDGSNPTKDPITEFNKELKPGGTFYVKTNKEATAKLNDVDQGKVAANTWKKLTLPEEAGIHILRLFDSNTGDMIYNNIAVQPRDSVAPVITLASSSIIVMEGSDVTSMNNAIGEGVSIEDDTDGPIIDYTVTGAPDSTKAGLYSLTYEAKDNAGNISKAYRTLYIMKEGTPLVKVNGEAALPYGRTVLSTRDIALEIVGMDGVVDVIKWKSGMKTTAQMKHSTSTVVDNAFTVPEEGFYTIYVRTRDRVEYVTYLYVED